ncbi:hypothetical protein ANN_26206 [Periplaneta americana]|uniref:NADH dehydrogenase [ubiquinone] 1 alpha subcomplex subunit 2 n=1 Tax=Periplaneta americana TaxID=6978 RepID=A0ABQ8S5N2_PERAM|nr:hypothetical protein ANN_26206 [Periplaneta americana]
MASRAAVKFAKDLKELRLHICQKSAASQGARDFIEKHYVSLKTANPKFPILVRECSGVQPRLYARYVLGQMACYDLTGIFVQEVTDDIRELMSRPVLLND